MKTKDIKDALEQLGYRLIDYGDHWRTAAIYRGGDNPTSLQIYKNTGVWVDYVNGSEYLPFKALLQKTLKTTDDKIIKKLFNIDDKTIQYRTKERFLLSEEKTYTKNCLKKLLPHYDFYVDRGVSEKTLQDYKCGLATSGKLYQRMVFPIFREDGLIHGFSGRSVNDRTPKWLHMGKTVRWFYPYFTCLDSMDSIEDLKKVFIVESIGDSLSMYDNDVKNNLVSFGVSLSSEFVSKLATLDLSEIHISFNNDTDKKENYGLVGAIKSIFKLQSVVDFEKLFIQIPYDSSDYGDMKDWDGWESHLLNHEESCDFICEASEDFLSKRYQKSFATDLKKFKERQRFLYG